jgi:hypothetical protein
MTMSMIADLLIAHVTNIMKARSFLRADVGICTSYKCGLKVLEECKGGPGESKKVCYLMHAVR